MTGLLNNLFHRPDKLAGVGGADNVFGRSALLLRKEIGAGHLTRADS